jgi:hypothetical protein
MEFHRYEYSEYDLTTFYVVKDGMTKCHVNCRDGEVKRSTTRPIPEPVNSEEIEESDLPENVQDEINALLTYYD